MTTKSKSTKHLAAACRVCGSTEPAPMHAVLGHAVLCACGAALTINDRGGRCAACRRSGR